MTAVLVKLAGIGTYLAFVAGIGSLCLNISNTFASHAVALAAPLLVVKGERQPTLVERRQIEAAVVIEADPEVVAFIPEAPSTPLPLLAAQMDVSETADLSLPIRVTPGNARPRDAKVGGKARVAAADVFGRSFGVMIMASR